MSGVRTDAIGARREDSQLLANVMGEENPGVVAHAPRSRGNHDRVKHQVRARREESQFVQWHFWVLERYDRPWEPERPVFGTVRYMSSENTARKFRVKRYVEKYSKIEIEEVRDD